MSNASPFVLVPNVFVNGCQVYRRFETAFIEASSKYIRVTYSRWIELNGNKIPYIETTGDTNIQTYVMTGDLYDMWMGGDQGAAIYGGAALVLQTPDPEATCAASAQIQN